MERTEAADDLEAWERDDLHSLDSSTFRVKKDSHLETIEDDSAAGDSSSVIFLQLSPHQSFDARPDGSRKDRNGLYMAVDGGKVGRMTNTGGQQVSRKK